MGKKSKAVKQNEVALKPLAPEVEIEIPDQSDFYKLPAQFGAIPEDVLPLGFEVETKRRETKITKFEQAYPRIYLPFQEVQRVEFGHGKQFPPTDLFPIGANRLFFGNNLHVMRQLPSRSIDLIYIDPPFFSGRVYNQIFGDKNEIRSFSDIWEGGMPGYLVWLNARLWEMKRLLKDTGSIYVHLDYHASHYVKVEMDKIFGNDNFLNEIIWCYKERDISKTSFNRKHDAILLYAKQKGKHVFNSNEIKEEYSEVTIRKFKHTDQDGRHFRIRGRNVPEAGVLRRKTDIPIELESEYTYRQYLDESEGSLPRDWFEIPFVNQAATERIGYPTQKPEEILDKFIRASSNEGDVVADFFTGGGTTVNVAQRLNRRWIACDQSRIATSITADRVTGEIEKSGAAIAAPDFTVEHWGIYEAPKLEKLTQEEFRTFVIGAFGGRAESATKNIHGIREGVPIYVGEPSRKSKIGKDDVRKFAQAIFEEKRTEFGVMLGWNFDVEARRAAEILKARENKRIDFVRLNLVRLEDPEFREHITSGHKDYEELLSFIQPPQVRVTITKSGAKKYIFDVSESVSLNPDGELANVQWDFDYRGRFTSTQGYAFMRKDGKPVLAVEYEFEAAGKKKIACSLQDNQGGEQTWHGEVEVK